MPTATAVLLKPREKRGFMSQLFVRTGIHFSSSQQALEHIGAEMLARGVVHDSYPAALLEREATFPTGIALEQHAVAIPHCEAMHANHRRFI